MNKIETDIRESLIAVMSQTDGYLSGEEMSERFGLSRTAIWKHIKSLEKLGFQFEASPRKGYRLRSATDELISALISPHLRNEARIGKQIIWAPERGSTNLTALDLASHGFDDGTVVTAGVQTSGVGRQQRAWTSPLGGMWFSVLLRSPCAVSQASDLTLLASVAVTRAMHAMGVDVKIKWPNDILLNGRKLCILAQIRSEGEMVDHAVIGIGINANFDRNLLPEQLQTRATTIQSELGKSVHRPTLLGLILGELQSLYDNLAKGDGGFSTVRTEWLQHCSTIHSKVTVAVGTQTITGEALDVDNHGILYIKDASDAIHRIHSGEVLFSASEKHGSSMGI